MLMLPTGTALGLGVGPWTYGPLLRGLMGPWTVVQLGPGAGVRTLPHGRFPIWQCVSRSTFRPPDAIPALALPCSYRRHAIRHASSPLRRCIGSHTAFGYVGN